MADPQLLASGTRLYGIAQLPAPTGSEAGAFDAASINDVGVPQPTLMENAGRSAAQVLHHLYPSGPVVAVVGGGNNGGDALVMLRTLVAWGRRVSALSIGQRPDAALLHGWHLPFLQVPSGDVRGMADALRSGSVIVDGLLGTGIKGVPRRPQAHAIDAMNGVESPVVALDVPSGVDADTGRTLGAAVRADATIAFGWAKLGTLIPPGRDHTGRLVAVEIGFPPLPATAFQQSIISPEWAHQTCPRRTSETHKYAAGSLLLVAGSPGMAGAAVMAARASQRAGLGLLRIASFPENRDVLQSTVPEAIFVDATDADDLETAIARSGAIAIGPGLGTGKTAADVVERVCMSESRAPTVLDADAITLAGSDRLDALTEWAHRRPLLLTPHTGELERISAHTRVAVAEDRVAVARAVAADLGVTLLLKGIPSVVAAPEGSVMVDVVGTSDLATGGMGDALTGAIGSFVAQGASLSDAASLGLYFTGRAAALAGKGAGLIPNDAIEALPRALGESGRGSTDLPFPFVHLDIRL